MNTLRIGRLKECTHFSFYSFGYIYEFEHIWIKILVKLDRRVFSAQRHALSEPSLWVVVIFLAVLNRGVKFHFFAD